MEEQEKKSGKKMPKVYSPDITPYSFEGRSYFFGTFLSIVVAPVRILSRVLHNIFVLPAELQEGYAQDLLIVSSILAGIGVFDLLMYHKWPLVVSQLPAIWWSLRLKKQAHISNEIAVELRTIEIDTAKVQKTAGSIYDELESILGE